MFEEFFENRLICLEKWNNDFFDGNRYIGVKVWLGKCRLRKKWVREV